MKCYRGKGFHKPCRSGKLGGHPFLLGPRARGIPFVPFSSTAARRGGAGHVSARPHPEACPLFLHHQVPRPRSAPCTGPTGPGGIGPGGPAVQGSKKTRKGGLVGRAGLGVQQHHSVPGERAPARPTPGLRGPPLPERATAARRHHREAAVPRAAAGGQVRRGPPGLRASRLRPAGGSTAWRPHVARARERSPGGLPGPGALGVFRGLASGGSSRGIQKIQVVEFTKYIYIYLRYKSIEIYF